MKTPYSLFKHFLFSILGMPFLMIHSVSSLNLTNEYLNHKCLLDQGKYTSGSEYEDNLNRLFRSVSSDASGMIGFAYTSIGSTPNFLTITLQCRGDSIGSKCHTCTDTAISEFRKRCPKNKGGIIWYDQCFLFVTTIKEEDLIKTNYENIFSMYNSNNVRGDRIFFAKRVRDFLYELTLKVEKTIEGDHIFLYAAGEKKLGKNKLYAMVQCIQLTLDCKSCLEWSIKKLFKNSDIKQGARVLGTNCGVRYELYPFLGRSNFTVV
ncbi:putative cysteine-rich repeat secretory protein 37 [Raphanus sativus]|uniref:Cysteine-rich repeat secretory protein 37 n=1 Tax=Raphanus sativus TaxID=3726 RepID=A0A6J0NZE3_RAPSA|nr:putative cysteine-rich repeat secretory protein 37 [Raphanus sativus]